MGIQRVNPGSTGEKKELLTEDQWEEWIHHDTVDEGLYVLDVPLEEILLLDQVRQDYSEDSIRELAESIRNQGLLQPIQLKREDNGYRIVYGHRRFLAAKHLGLPMITAIVDYASDVDILTKQIVENIQREDLHPIDEALALKQLMELKSFKQVELAAYIGKSKFYISEILSLLNLLDKKVVHVQLFRNIKDRRILIQLSRVQDEKLLQKALQMVEKGCSRSELQAFLSSAAGKDDRKPAEKNRKEQAMGIVSSSQKVIKTIEKVGSDIKHLLKNYKGDFAAKDLEMLGNRLRSRLDEIKQLLSSLFNLAQQAESSGFPGQKAQNSEATSLVFPGTAAIASLSYKLVSISFSFISYSYSYSSSNKNIKKEISQFILKRLPNLERDVLEEATVEEIIDYWNSLPFKKIEKSVEGFFYQSLAKRYSLPERYLELKAEALASLARADGTGDSERKTSGHGEPSGNNIEE